MTKTWVVGNKEMTGKSVTGQRCYQLIALMGRMEESLNLKKPIGLSKFVRKHSLNQTSFWFKEVLFYSYDVWAYTAFSYTKVLKHVDMLFHSKRKI